MMIRNALADTSVARRDAEVLLCAVLTCGRTYLFAHPERELTDEEWRRFQSYVDRRKHHEPVAYILGEKEFYGRPFIVTPDVLIPRPATEALIEQAIDIIKNNRLVREIKEIDTEIACLTDVWGNPSSVTTIVDCGTGSGCIAATLALALPHLKIIATDVSAAALSVAAQNIDRCGLADRVELREGSALAPVSGLQDPFLIVSNPPYVPASYDLAKDVQAFEPHLALFADNEGADIVSLIAAQAKTHPHCIGFVMECRTEHATVILR